MATRMVENLGRMAKNNTALIVGGTFAAGLLVGTLLHRRRARRKVEIVFEPEGDWRTDGRGTSDDADILPLDEAELVMVLDRDPREMTPDLAENISADHPSEPTPSDGRHSLETPVRSPIAGRETLGPGIRTGSSGAAALDAGSSGTVHSWNRRSGSGEGGG